jgi:hypothetical protein
MPTLDAVIWLHALHLTPDTTSVWLSTLRGGNGYLIPVTRRGLPLNLNGEGWLRKLYPPGLAEAGIGVPNLQTRYDMWTLYATV